MANMHRMIDAALFREWRDRTPRSRSGKRLYGVNARRRRQARARAEMNAAIKVLNRMEHEWNHMVDAGAVRFIEF